MTFPSKPHTLRNRDKRKLDRLYGHEDLNMFEVSNDATNIIYFSKFTPEMNDVIQSLLKSNEGAIQLFQHPLFSYNLLTFPSIEDAVAFASLLEVPFAYVALLRPPHIAPSISSFLQDIVHENFINESYEEQLIQYIEDLDSSYKCADKLKQRRAYHFGYKFNYDDNHFSSPSSIESIPEVFNELMSMLQHQLQLPLFDQLTINVYEAERQTGIPSHVDTHSDFDDTIVSVSLSSGVVFDMKNCMDDKTMPWHNLYLPGRSVLVMKDDVRYGYKHRISPRTTDYLHFKSNGTVQAVDMSNFKHLDCPDDGYYYLTPRGTRYSLTFRKLRPSPRECKCSFPHLCDSQEAKYRADREKEVLECLDGRGKVVESTFVRRTYDKIASHFSKTRYKAWPKVDQFVARFEHDSFIADVGCGNGKYLTPIRRGNNDDFYPLIIGMEPCEGLLHCAQEKSSYSTELVQNSAFELGVRHGIFDGVICIAVLHHFSTLERRSLALCHLLQLLDIGGRLLVTVWARKQPQNDGKQAKTTVEEVQTEMFEGVPLPVQPQGRGVSFVANDVLVPWTNDAGDGERSLRYYHVFDDGELDELFVTSFAKVGMCNDGAMKVLKLVDSFEDAGNYACVAERIS